MSNDDVFCATHNYGDQPCIIPVEQPYTSPVDNPGRVFTPEEMHAMCIDPVQIEVLEGHPLYKIERVICYYGGKFYAIGRVISPMVTTNLETQYPEQPIHVRATVVTTTVWESVK